MDGAVASFAVERLGNLLLKEVNNFIGVGNQVQQIQTQLARMQRFLKVVHERQDEDDRVVGSIAEIREVAQDAEDVFETYVVEVASRRRLGLKRYFCIFKECLPVRKIGLEIKAINNKISDITTSLSTFGINLTNVGGGEGTTSMYERRRELRRTYSHDEEEVVVGLERDTNELVARLVNEDAQIAIWGMGGLGKTTLVKKVYHHRDVRRHFDCFAWVCISQQWQTKDVLQKILIQFTNPYKDQREEIEIKRDEELAKELYHIQKEKKCLVILDDMWKCEAWDCLHPAFPKTKGGSKIVVTTRIKEVALHIGQQIFLHEVKCLTDEQSLELFWRNATPKKDATDINAAMEQIGREIVTKCAGLPMAIVVMGRLLAKKSMNEWKTVLTNMNMHLGGGKGHQKQYVTVFQVLALSYRDLPYYLKPCFLYLALFPEDYEIPAENLVRMLVAEGLVLPYNEEGEEVNETMVDITESYLDELVERSMVQVQLDPLSGRVNKYRLHDLMREFCLSKAKEENFVKLVHLRRGNELLMGDSSSASLSTSTKIRRLAMYHDDVDILYTPHGRETNGQYGHLRSVLFFNFHWEGDWQKIKRLLNHLNLIRVLDLSDFWDREDTKLLRAIGKLMHLRYLSLRGSRIRKLPSSIGDLRCLQTLDLWGYEVYIPNVLWKMEQLRHLYLPRHISTNRNTKLRLDGLSNLETLENFVSSHCHIECMPKLINLRELQGCKVQPIAEELGVILTSPSITSSNNSNIGRLRRSSFFLKGGIETEEQQTLLQQLLGCGHLHKLTLSGFLVKLPEHHQFPSELTQLELKGTKLEDDPMPALEKLPHLRSLRLWEESYTGREMVCSAPTPPASGVGDFGGGFPQLKYLHLIGLENLEDWRVDEGAMPSLRRLLIGQCINLKGVPDGLRFTTALEELRIFDMPEAFENRVREGGEDFDKVQHVPDIAIM